MSAAEERWLPAVGFEGRYEVSSLGRVKRVFRGERIKSPSIDSWGYLVVCLSGPNGQVTRYVHTMVALAFLGPRPPGKEINHKSGVKTDASVDNLEYVTPEENRRHAWETGLTKIKPQVPLTSRQRDAIRLLKARGYSATSIARALKISSGRVSQEIASEDGDVLGASGSEVKYRKHLVLAAAIIKSAEVRS